MRVRRFTMKDSYTFDMDSAGLDAAYQRHYGAYCRIFDRCGLEYLPVDAHSGAMGGSESCEFMVPSAAGEDWLIECPASGYRANLEKAATLPRPPSVPDPEGDSLPEEFATPGKKTIEEVSEFDGLPASSHIKALVMVAQGKPLMALLRGDHQLSETKLAAEAQDPDVRPAHPAEIEQWLGAGAGFIGPVRAGDIALLARQGSGGSPQSGRRGQQGRHSLEERHARARLPGALRRSARGRGRRHRYGLGAACAAAEAIEVGHIFKLGYKYSESMGLSVLDENGKAVTPIMGSYGIGVERVLTGAIEQNNDDAGMALPVSIAPFEAVVTPVNLKNEDQRRAAEKLYAELREAGVDVLLDDRAERAGVKFKDADLIGIPYRITVGRNIAEGLVELTERSTGRSDNANIEEIAKLLVGRISEAVA